jgi:hypothetical protein
MPGMPDTPFISTTARRVAGSAAGGNVCSIAKPMTQAAYCNQREWHSWHRWFEQALLIVAARQQISPSDQVLHCPVPLAARALDLFAAAHKSMVRAP